MILLFVGHGNNCQWSSGTGQGGSTMNSSRIGSITRRSGSNRGRRTTTAAASAATLDGRRGGGFRFRFIPTPFRAIIVRVQVWKN